MNNKKENTIQDNVLSEKVINKVENDIIPEEETTIDKYKRYEKLFKKMLGVDFHNHEKADVGTVATKNFILYSASVVIGRSIPDLRDGLKVSQRRALYSMKNMGISHSGKYKKAARITGDTIGKFHPHGDIAVYDTMVNLSQPWKQNLPLIDGQGNWGSIDGDSPANQRYTECRLTRTASLMFKDIENDTVDFIPNYDGEEIEPTVLPAPIPLILINGVLRGSIAVGMASSILPHNISEIIKVTQALISKRKINEDLTPEEFLSIVPAPDFPTGGIVYNTGNMLDIIKNGRGGVRVRSRHHIETNKKKNSIIITELPWGKVKPRLIQQIVDLKKNNKENKLAQAISSISDQSDTKIRIVIDIKNGWDPELVWNYILKNTDFDTSISYFSIVIDRTRNSAGEMAYVPREYGLLSILNRYVDHRFEVLTRKYNTIKTKSEKLLHIIEGFIKAIDIIDDIIKLIKSSKNSELASKKIIKEFGFSELQASAILGMRLSKLTSIQKKEMIEEKRKFKAVIKDCNEVLNNYTKQCEVLIEELTEVDNTIGTERKTEIKNELGNINLESVIPKEDCIVYLTHKGYVKRVSSKNISSQNRGTKGKKGIELTEGDFIYKIFNTNSHSNLFFITEKGHVFATKAYNIPDTNKGSYIQNIIEMEDKNKIVEIIEAKEISDSTDLILFTRLGNVKRTKLTEYNGAFRKKGINGINLIENDIVTNGHIIEYNSKDSILIATHEAKSIKFKLSEIKSIGRTSKGIRGIKLKENDFVIKSAIINNESSLICTITDQGMAKVSNSKDFKEQSRAGVGVICMSLTKKSGKLISLLSWEKEGSNKDIVTITEQGVINRIKVEDINQTGRVTKGVKLVEVNNNDRISMTILADRSTQEYENIETED